MQKKTAKTAKTTLYDQSRLELQSITRENSTYQSLALRAKIIL